MPNLKVTRTTLLDTDNDENGIVDPGDILRTTIVIEHDLGSVGDALNVVINDSYDGSTLVPNSINVSPIANNDTYAAIGNTLLVAGGAANPSGAPALTTSANVFDNDSDTLSGSPDTFTASVASSATAQGGTVTMSSNGAFTYTPAAGFTGADSFTYTITDSGGLTNSATVTINVSSQVWYVNGDAASNGNGTSTNPFNSFASINSTPGVDANDVIHVRGTTEDSVTLDAGQQLIGSGVALVVNGHTLMTAGSNATLGVTSAGAATVVTLGTDNTVRGVTINSNGAGVVGMADNNGSVTSAAGTLTVSNVSFGGTGQAIDIDQGGNLSMAIDSVSSSGSGAQAVQLAGTATSGTGLITGSVTITNGTIGGATGSAFLIGAAADVNPSDGGNVNVTYGGTIGSTSGTTVEINDRSGGSVTFNGAISDATAGTATAILIDGIAAGGTVTFATTVDLDTSTGTGVSILNNLGTVTFSGGGTGLDITTTSGIGFSAGSGTVSVLGSGNSINSTAGTALSLSGTTIGASGMNFSSVSSGGGTNNVSLTNVAGTIAIGGGTLTGASGTAFLVSGGSGNITFDGSISDDLGQLVSISGRTGGTIDFNGLITDLEDGDGGVATADGSVDLSSNTGATIRFDGGLRLSTGANEAFQATGGGTVVVTDPDGAGATHYNRVATTTGVALDVQNTTIGANGLTFLSISANGAPNGIVLNNTGSSGGLTVTGSGSSGSGGTIQNTTGAGIVVDGTKDLSLNWMNVTNSGTDGINIQNINGMTLNRLNIIDNNSTSGVPHQGIQIGDFSTGTAVNGTINITNTSVTYSSHDNLAIGIGSGTSTWNITGSTFSFSGGDGAGDGSADVSGNSGVNVEIRNSAVVSLFTFTGNTLEGNYADGMQIQPASVATGSLTALIQGNTFKNNNIGLDLNSDASADMTYHVINNTFLNDTRRVAGGGIDAAGQAINVFTSALGTSASSLNARIEGNVIGDNNLAGSGSANGSGMRINYNGGGGGAVLINNNQIYETPNGRGIEVIGRSGTGQLDVTITNNTIDHTNLPFHPSSSGGASDFPLAGIFIQSNNIAGAGAYTVRADVRSNTVVGNGTIGELSPGWISMLETNTSTLVLVDSPAGPAGQTAAQQLSTANPSATSTSTNAGVSLIAGPISTPPAAPAPMMAATSGPGDITGNDGAPEEEQVDNPQVDNDETGATQDNRQHSEPVPADDGAVAPTGPVVVDDGILSQAELTLIIDAAIARWEAAGATPEQIAAMRAVTVSVSDLGGLQVGSSTAGTIVIDDNAAGWRWFVDATPDSDEEFLGSGTVLTAISNTNEAGTRIDLLTVMMHELGHQIGLSDSYAASDAHELMSGTVRAGERRLPGADDAAAGGNTAVSGSATLAAINYGTLVNGETITVTYRTEVPGQTPNGPVTNVTGQTTVSGSNFTTVQSDSNPVAGGAQQEIVAVDSLRIGNLVFFDVGKDGQYDSGTDQGIDGVSLTLFADTGTVAGELDAGDTQIGSSIETAGGGLYSFSGLAPGNYIVRVDASNFTSGNELSGYYSSVGGNDADADVDDNDDNGVAAFGGSIASHAITLSYGGETHTGPTGPALDTNNTLDFGFELPNQTPENTVGGAASGNEDSAFALTGMSVADDEATGDVTYTLSVDNGTLTLLTSVMNGIEATDIVSGNGSDTVVVSATLAQINTTLGAANGLTYLSDLNYNGSDTLTVTLNDGGQSGQDPGGAPGSEEDVDTRAITVNATNDPVTGSAPATLDVDQNTATAVPGLSIADDDTALAPNGVYVATLSATNGTLTLTTTTGLTFSAGDGAGNTTMTFRGTLADINTALATASYTPTTGYTGAADITLAVTDTFGGTVATGTGAATNDSDSIVVTVSAGNAAPVVDLDGTDPAINYSTTYTEGGASVALGDTITVTDADGDAIEGAVITITDWRAGDQIVFAPLPAGWSIDETFGGPGGVEKFYTISGVGVAADYEAFLNAARFSSTSNNPTANGTDLARTVLVTVSDATGTSSPAEATIGIIAENDPLTINAADTDVQGTEDSNLVFSSGNSNLIAIDDPDEALLTVTLTVTNGTLTLSQTTNLNITAGADGSATMTIEGLASDINAALAGLIYRGGLNYQGTDTLAISVGDGVDSDSENIAITLSDDGKIDGTPGGDDIVGTPQPDFILGYGSDDDIDGGDSNDIIDGGTGADNMSGGLGNDTYYVDDAGDLTNENPGEGNDAVSSTIDWTLQANTENLRLLGTGDIDGTGNSLANVIIGNSGQNTLDGGEGADTLNGMGGDDVMIGGLGNDTFFVDSAGDLTIENPGEGIDTVRSTVAWTLSANVENLMLIGNGAINGLGNGLSNSISGNSAFNILSGAGGDDTLSGGAGPDQLIGGTGDDVYVVDDAGDDVVENMNDGTDHVLAAIIYTLAANVENVTLTGSSDIGATGNGLNNRMIGNSGANVLNGGGGHDALDGRAGADTMAGGTGNDAYIVDDENDDVAENFNEGTDSVQSSISYAIGDNIEYLFLSGSGNIDGTGNGLANSIEGNGGNNVIDGGAGADMMRGHDGNDTYVVDDAGDRAVELSATGGTDTVLSSVHFNLGAHVENLTLTGTGNTRGNGNGLANVLTGNVGNNTLNGLGGADTMTGGMGNDIYFVDDAGDDVVENSGEGVDTVHAAISHTLADHVDYLYLSGTGNINGTGNGLDNTMEGNAGNNVLDGGAGADFMRGGAGNDTYVVDNALDKAVELNAAGGTDTVQSSVSFILAGHLENLTLTGSANINGTGNTLANTIAGNSGNNVLRGNVGADALTGGAGTDTFIYGLVADSDAANGIDTILDFFSGDKIDLSAIDANGAGAGNGTFSFTAGAFTNVAGQLRVEDMGGYWEIQGDTDGDGDADLVINLVLADADPITSGDFIL